MSRSSLFIRRLFRKSYALPAEHGAWIWWIGPFILGLAAGGSPNLNAAILFLGALAAFLSRQPTTLLVKVMSRRRPRGDLAPSLVWMVFYASIALGSAVFLVRVGYHRLILLAIPGIPVFASHLWMVSRREERGQQRIELVGSGILALSAPAAYWISGGENSLEAWILWALSWLQSAASIVYVYLRLRQRKLERVPLGNERWRMGIRTLVYHLFNTSASAALAFLHLVPVGVPLAFALILLEAIDGVAHPPVGAKPSAIGIRQLASSAAFFSLMAASYALI